MAKKVASVSAQSPLFLVRFNQRYFFSRRDKNGPRGTLYPSAGTHLTYDDADEICRRIRDSGFPDALVVDRQGRPVAEVPAAEHPSPVVTELWSGQISDNMLMAFLNIKEPEEVALELGLSISELNARIESISKRLDTAAAALHRDTGRA